MEKYPWASHLFFVPGCKVADSNLMACVTVCVKQVVTLYTVPLLVYPITGIHVFESR